MENILRAFEKSRAEGKPGVVDRTAPPVPAAPRSHAPDAAASEEAVPERRETPPDSAARLEAESAAARASARTVDEALAAIAEADAASHESWGDAPPPAGGQPDGDAFEATVRAERPTNLAPVSSAFTQADSAGVAGDRDGDIAIPVSPPRQPVPIRKRRSGALRRAGIAAIVLIALAAAGVLLVQTDPQVAAAWDEFRTAFQLRATLFGEWAGRFLDLD